MKRSRKSNRVSWAPGANLRQVKLFLVEDCPSKVGIEPEANVNAKSSLRTHPYGMSTNDLPPGFRGSLPTNLKNVISHIPRIQWKCPPKFIVNPSWQVVAGEESQEVETQKDRQMKVFEAMYPRLSDVPPSPAVSLGVNDERYDDRQTPLVPLNPLEDEDEDTDVPSELAHKNTLSDIPTLKYTRSDFPAQKNTPQNPFTQAAPNTLHHNIPAPVPPPNGNPPTGGINPDVMLAASAVLTTLMKTKEEGSMIDTDLLVKILTDPKKVEELVKDQRALSTNANAIVSAATVPTSPRVSAQQTVPKSVTPSAPSPAPYSAPFLPPTPAATRDTNHALNMLKPASSMPAPASSMTSPPQSVSVSRTAAGNVYSIPNRMQPAVSVMPVQQISVPKVLPTVSTVPVQPILVPPVNPNPAKDDNYYKKLIREHGIEEKGVSNVPQMGFQPNYNQVPATQNLKSGQVNIKNGKPCNFFGTARGCRRGTSCPFFHDVSGNWRTGNALEAPSAKRMKIGGEITGR